MDYFFFSICNRDTIITTIAYILLHYYDSTNSNKDIEFDYGMKADSNDNNNDK